MNTLGDIGTSAISLLTPELYLAGAAMLLLIYGVYYARHSSSFMTLAGMVIIAVTLYLLGTPGAAKIMNGMVVLSPFTHFAKMLLLVATAILLLLSDGWLQEEKRPFEFVVLTLLALLGMMFMVSANDMLIVYMGLEMSSLSLYVLASFTRDHAKSSEAGLKYFVLGALASGMLLFGISLVYGFAGTTSFPALFDVFSRGSATPGIVVGMVLVIIGFCFKLSAVPFHMWTPDVYEGAPTPVTAFFATAPKVAALALFTRVLLQPFGPLIAEWQQVIIFVSLGSMLVGALAAIMQTNLKRLLAYSSIGHAGFMLMGLAAGNIAGVQAVLIYLALYIFMSAAAFGCVLLMRRDGQALEDIRELKGLSQTNPAMAVAIAILMFSMAGIPPMSGFFGKLYVVLAAVQGGLVWLAVIGVVTSVIGCYYYIKIVKLMYFDEPAAAFDKGAPLSLKIAVTVGTLVTFLFFLVPTPLVAAAKIAASEFAAW